MYQGVIAKEFYLLLYSMTLNTLVFTPCTAPLRQVPV